MNINFGVITRLFRKSSPTQEFSTEFAFECGGKKYYRFTDINTMPALRALHAMTIFQEMQMGISKEYLTKHVQKTKEILSDPKKININELVKVNHWLDERLKFIISKDIIYNIASVSIIEEGEIMGNYDEVFNKRKIENWKANGKEGFFLNKNLRDLVPFLRKYGDYSLTYLDMVDKVEQSLSDLAQLNTYAQELRTEKD